MSSGLLEALGQRLSTVELPPPGVCGVLTRVTGMLLGARGVRAPLGAYCEVMAEQGEGVTCEVVGFNGDEVMLMPLATVQGLLPGTGVRVVTHTARVGVGDALLGRVVDGLGRPLDGGDEIEPSVFVALRGERRNPLHRAPIDGVLDVGVRAINSFLTIGRGQRIGLIAGSGVGKSVLLGMMTRFTAADVVVIGMIGERGREVLDFVTETLGEEGRRRAVVVAAPGDRSPVVRLRATHYTCAIAEHFRDQGKNVLLLMDSLTRVAHAQREVGLAVGEPPTTKGYTPSVFSLINELVERAGSVASGGSVTGIYTILAEGDDANDPIVDGARAILDGHVLLSRELAAMGQYPAIDINFSVSRLANRLVTDEQRALVRRFRRLMATWEENRDLVSVGAYRSGTNPELDEALQRRSALQAFLQQDVDERIGYDGGFRQLAEALS
ncbi:MAG: FliI/YscN family ATPase [Gammaproteobacteria bacterium]